MTDHKSCDEVILKLCETIVTRDRVIKELEQKIAVLEELRPHWAKGYSSDSIAAQVSFGALSEIWKILGVDNQTGAIEKLKRIVS